MFVRSRLLFLKCENTEGKPSSLARKPWGQLLGGSTIEGDLDWSVGTEGCGINTATLCVRGRSRMGSDRTGVDGGGTRDGSLDALGMVGGGQLLSSLKIS